MKRIFRVLALILITVILASSLSGCLLIDEMREEQAFIGEENTIEYKGKKYMLLPVDEALKPIAIKNNSVSVTEKDVPVLLSAIMGMPYDVSDDGVFIFTYSVDSYLCYCIEDYFDEISKKLANGYDMNSFCYEYFNYEEDEYRFYQLSEEEKDAVLYVIRNVEPQELPVGAMLDYDYLANIEACSDDMYFRKDIARITVKNSVYQVVITEYEGTENEQTLLYRVPDDLNNVFEKIMKPMVDNEFYIDEY